MGPVCIFLLVVSAALSVDAFGGPPRPQYNRPPYNYKQGYNQYNQGVQYNKRNYGYQSQRYSNKGLSVLPPCTTGFTRLEIGVVGPDGTCMPDVCVYVTDKSSSTNVTTNSYGLAAVNVKGCTARVAVNTIEYETKVLDIDLESCEDGKQKVVVSLSKTCNFNIYFQSFGINNFGSVTHNFNQHLISYEYTTSSGATGFGTTVGGCIAGPTCIYVNTDDPDNERLKITVRKAYGGNTVNVLEVSKLDSYDGVHGVQYGAKVTVPQLYDGIDPEKILFYIHLNVWIQSLFSECGFIVCINYAGSSLVIVNDSGNIEVIGKEEAFLNLDSLAPIIKLSGFDKPVAFAVDKLYATSKDILICLSKEAANFGGTFPSTVFLQGGIAFVDSSGKVTTNEIDGEVEFFSLGSGVFGIVNKIMPFCVCEGDPEKVMAVHPDNVIADACPTTACGFYEICPCTPAVPPTGC